MHDLSYMCLCKSVFVQIFQVMELLLEDKIKLIDLILRLMEGASGQKLLKEDGAQDEVAIDK